MNGYVQNKPADDLQKSVTSNKGTPCDLLRSNKLLHTIDSDENSIIYGDAEYCLGDVEKREIEYNVHKMNGFAKTNSSEKLWFAKENSIRKVFINCKVNRISEIDNVQQQYRMKFDIDFIFIPTLQEYLSYSLSKINDSNDGNDRNETDHWHRSSFYPSIHFDNQIDTHQKQWKCTKDGGIFTIEQFGHPSSKNFKNHRIPKRFKDRKDHQFDMKCTKFVHCAMSCDITFAEELELQAFPFDCQVSIFLTNLCQFVNLRLINAVYIYNIRMSCFVPHIILQHDRICFYYDVFHCFV